jgi:mono/diheme cytochrome c family protein
MRGFAIGFGLVLLVGMLVLVILRARGSAGGADPNNQAQVRAGQAVYAARCASCHGANLEGQANWKVELPTGGRPAPPHDATGHTWHHADALLFDIVKRGGQASSPTEYKNLMPAFGDTLRDDEIWAVLSYIKSTWPADIRALQDEVNQQAQ